jgi:Spy/CpxP family protein refolding chaperone
MLRKLFSLGALVVVALAFGVGSAAAAKPGPPSKPGHNAGTAGFSDGRDGGAGTDGFSDGRI